MDDSGIPLFQDFRKPPCLLGRNKLPYQARSAPIHRCLLAPGCSLSKRLNHTHLILSKFPWEAIAIMGKKKSESFALFSHPSALQGPWKIPHPLRSWRWPSFCHQETWRSTSRIPAGSQKLKSTSLGLVGSKECLWIFRFWVSIPPALPRPGPFSHSTQLAWRLARLWPGDLCGAWHHCGHFFRLNHGCRDCVSRAERWAEESEPVLI